MSLKQLIISHSALALLIVVGSCSSGPLDEKNNNDIDPSIAFKTYENCSNTKSEVTTKANLKQFNVFSFQTAADINYSVDTPEFMFNKAISLVDGNWTYSPIRYWPDDNSKLSFWAYGPTDNTQPDIQLLSPKDRAGAPLLSYTLSSDSKNIKDFVVSEPVENRTKANPNVAFQFSHALAKVNLNFKLASTFPIASNEKVYLEYISIGPILSYREYSHPAWTAEDPTKKNYKYELSIEEDELKNIQISKNAQNLINDDVKLLMIPGSTTDVDMFFKITIERYNGNKLIESSTIVYKALLSSFVRDLKINSEYTLSLTFVEKNSISITATVKDWTVKEIQLPSFE